MTGKDAMVSVRFPGAIIRSARQLAARDRLTVSEWVRRLVDREISKPRTWANFSDYPMTVTRQAAPVAITWTTLPAQSGGISQ